MNFFHAVSIMCGFKSIKESASLVSGNSSQFVLMGGYFMFQILVM